MHGNKKDGMTGDDAMIDFLNRVIRQVARVLAAIMVLVIIWGVFDVVYVLYERLMAPGKPLMLLDISDILATAVMPIARKVVIFDFKEISPEYIYGSAMVTLALVIGYYLIALRGAPAAHDSPTARDIDAKP